MTDFGGGQPSGNMLIHPHPREASFLASPPKRTKPGAGYLGAESSQGADVGWDRVVAVVPTEHRPQPFTLRSDWLMAAELHLLLDRAQFDAKPFAHGVPG
jgi:hypothetical protein